MVQAIAMNSTADGGLGPYSAEDVTTFRARGDWQDRILYDVVAEHANDYPERVFVTDGTMSLTYGEIRERAVRLAAGLKGLGIGRGDRVAVQMPNWAEFAFITTALSRLGVILVPIMPIFRYDEVKYSLEHSGAVAIIGPEHFHKFDYLQMYRQLRADVDGLRNVIITRSSAPHGLGAELSLESLQADGSVADLDGSLGDAASADDGFMIIYTSGTTSRPKGCYHTFNTAYACAVGMNRLLGIDQSDVFFNPSPVSHSTGLVTGLIMPLIAGASAHFQPEWNAQEGIRRIEAYGCTVTVTATTFLATVMQAFDEQQHSLASMRYWICAGAPIPGAIVQEARSKFDGCAVLSLYGRSENFTATMCGPADPAERSVMSDGHALPGAAMKVVDRTGAEVPFGQDGDLAYRGPSHMLGYYNNPEETAKLFTADGFSRSGDLGFMDADGFVRVSGRIKDIIIRGGLNISSREVEDLLSGHPAISAVAIVAMPDPRLGEKCCAYVVARPGAAAPTLEDLVAYLSDRQVAVQKLPERLELAESLPMTAAGKIRKDVLRARIADKLAAEKASAHQR